MECREHRHSCGFGLPQSTPPAPVSPRTPHLHPRVALRARAPAQTAGSARRLRAPPVRLRHSETPTAVLVRSGDTCIMGGPSRKAVHGVPRIFGATSPEFLWEGAKLPAGLEYMKDVMKGRRINISLRQVHCTAPPAAPSEGQRDAAGATELERGSDAEGGAVASPGAEGAQVTCGDRRHA